MIGSLDRPSFTEGRDVDLVVEGLRSVDGHAAEVLAIKTLEAPVDVLRLEELAPSFRETVLREIRW